MYEGYLTFGGNEIINSSRTLGYTSTSGCGVSWLNCAPCDGVAEALDDNLYTFENIEEAPWYDEQEPASHRFYGVHGIIAEGVTDSTRTAEVSESVGHGGVVSRPRHATRRMRFEVLLTAQGEDALEYGLAWLNAALIPRDCVLHGETCGEGNLEFFTACPPERSDFTMLDELWGEPVVNLYTNPSFEGDDIPVGAEVSEEWSASGGRSLYIVGQIPGAGFGHGPFGHEPFGH